MDGPTHTVEIEIQTSRAELWQALTDPQLTRQYWYGALNHSTWKPGARWTSESAEGELFLDGEIVEIDPPLRLVHTFHVVHEPEAAAESPSTLTLEISAMGDACVLRATHENVGPATMEYITGGWEHILAGLKRMLETGSPLKVGGPLTL